MISFDHGPTGPAVFETPRETIFASTPAEVAPALARLEAARRAGGWIAGWIGYEAGMVFETRLKGLGRANGQPLLVFGVYDGPRPVPEADPSKAGRARLAPLEPMIAREAYDRAFAKVQDYIAAGDCYQVNLTFPLATRLIEGTPRDLAAALAAAQPVGFGAYVDLAPGPVIVSRSPELFFRLSATGAVELKPMKGTAPRHPDPEADRAAASELALSEKNRAENLMIVDLLRNDIARLAKVGSVRVPELYHIDSFATVHQMSSRITAELAAPASFPALIEALFPCGSITGAPKIRAMQIIAEIEPHARGPYCGAFGWMAPDGAAAFSVGIRTLVLEGDKVTLNVGGGVVRDSTAESEWEEALWKARYVMPLIEARCA